MPCIRITSGAHTGKVFDLKDTVITIGRDATQTIQVLDQGISRQHAEIFRIGEMCFVRDLNSTNGTYVNTMRITEELLRSGDQLQVGTTVMSFEDKSSTAIMRQLPEVHVVGNENEKIGRTIEIRMDTTHIKSKEPQAAQEVDSKHLSLIFEIGKIIGGEKDLDSVMNRALELVAKAVDAGAAYLFLHDKASGKVAPRYVYEQKPGLEKKISKSIMRRVLQTGKPILTSDASADDRFSLSESVVLKKIKSAICAPVMFKDKITGFMYLHSKHGTGAFTMEDLEVAASASLQLSMALSHFVVSQETHRGLLNTIRTLVTAIEIIEPQGQGHSERVADYCTAIAAEMGLLRPEIQKIRLAALLHDVGKLAVHGAGATAKKEEGREKHVYLGEKILSGIHGLEDVLPGVKYHHERADGSGFPYKVKNSDTPVMARVIIAANAFDNMCTHGGLGGQGMAVKEVLLYMSKQEQTEFDPAVVQALLVAHRNGTLYNPPSLFE